MLVEMVNKLVKGATENEVMSIANPTGVGTYNYTMKAVYLKPPRITADNFFSSDALMNWLGEKGVMD